MAMIDAFVPDRIKFCREMVAAALKRGDTKNAAEWQGLIEMWQQSAYFAEGDEDGNDDREQMVRY